MQKKIELSTIIIILLTAGFLRFYNLMYDSPYFFNPDERNMANSITQFRLPKKLSQIPVCLISQISQISPVPTSHFPVPTSDCNLNPHFFAYGQFPLYLAYISDQIFRFPISLSSQIRQISSSNQSLITHKSPAQPSGRQITTSFPSAIFWLRFWSAFSSTLTVLLVYLITKELFRRHSGKRGTSASRIPMGSWTSQDDNGRIYLDFLAALMAAFTPGLIQAAHFGTTESLLTFFFLASVYLSIRLSGSPFSISHLRYILLLSLVIGLSLGTKLTGLFFFIPPLLALAIRTIKLFRKRSKNWTICIFAYLHICIFLILGSLFFYVLSSPYNLIEKENFKSAVFGYESDVATGRYKAFYTRQFVNTIPILFQAEKIFPHALGWPVFILGSLGILFLTLELFQNLTKVLLRRITNYELRITGKKKTVSFTHDSYFVILASLLVYLIPNSFLFAKWTRFMTPILPFFSIFTAYAVQQILNLITNAFVKIQNSKFKIQNYKSKVKSNKLLNFNFNFCLLTFAFCLLAIFPGIAFMSIYTKEDSRVTASKWIYENIPNNSYILSETANVVDIPLGLPNYQLPITNYQVISFDFYHLDENPFLFEELLNHLGKSDYIFIPSRRLFANYMRLPKKYPLVTKYYQLLFSGRLGFEKVAEISSFPQLPISQIGPIRLITNDENAEETFTVFDHPVIRIYQKTKPLTKEQYRFLFEN